jgi:hypothetical protein
MTSFQQKYYRFFNIAEIEKSLPLKILFFCIALSFFSTFQLWFNGYLFFEPGGQFKIASRECSAFLPECKNSILYHLLDIKSPYQPAIFVGLFAVLIYTAFAAMWGNWLVAHQLLLALFIFKLFFVKVMTSFTDGSDIYDMAMAICWLFLSNKLYFARIAFVTLYFISAIAKMSDSWIFGNYFIMGSFDTPLMDTFLRLPITNFVIFQQAVLCWLLFSNKKLIQKAIYLMFHCFHLFSGLIVGYDFLCISLVSLIALFGDKEDTHFKKINKSTIAGYIFITAILCGQLLTFTIPGDYRKTGEGMSFGIFLFRSSPVTENHFTAFYKDGTKDDNLKIAVQTRFFAIYNIRKACRANPLVDRIAWQQDLSLNGDYFERIIDVPNACNLKYKPLSRNKWIKIDGETAKLNKKPVAKHPRYENPKLLKILHAIYWTMWITTLLYLVRKVILAGNAEK